MPLPIMPYNLADGEKVTVKVFRDHPAWDEPTPRGLPRRWWELPRPLLAELFVAAYEVEDRGQLDWLENKYPGHVFVY